MSRLKFIKAIQLFLMDFRYEFERHPLRIISIKFDVVRFFLFIKCYKYLKLPPSILYNQSQIFKLNEPFVGNIHFWKAISSITLYCFQRTHSLSWVPFNFDFFPGFHYMHRKRIVSGVRIFVIFEGWVMFPPPNCASLDQLDHYRKEAITRKAF